MKNRIIFIFITLLLLIINSLSGSLGFKLQFIIIGVVNFVLCIYLLKSNPFKYYGLFLIFSSFLLFNGVFIYSLCKVNSGYIGLTTNIICNISSVFAILTYYSTSKKKFVVVYFLLFIVLAVNFNNMFNFYISYLDRNEIVNKKLPDISIYNSKGDTIELKTTGKILVIDLWSNSCGYCIQAFPKFEKLKNQYKNDKTVDFIAINVDEKVPNRKRGLSLVEKYTFTNYFAERDILQKLNFSLFPNYMVVGKDSTIKYFGSLNMDKLETYNNIYDLIENEK